LPIAVFLELIQIIFANYLLEYFLKHIVLLRGITNFKIKEFQNKQELFGDGVGDDFHLTSEDFFDHVFLLLGL